MNLQQLTQIIVEGEPLENIVGDIETAADEMMRGEPAPVQVAALLTALRTRGETPAVIAAFARVLRARALPFRRPDGILVDTCGTGGDYSGTFNISTAAAFVVAGAGVNVAKHGNRSMTSKCGSADVLQELGVNIECEPAVMEKALRETGICFLFAQCYHLSMRNVAAVRRELGFRTVFNMIGPLSNPAGASHQLLGVGTRRLAPVLADVLALLGTQKAMVVHGEDGLDEISTTAPTLVYHVSTGSVTEEQIFPERFGIKRASPGELKGGDVAENASILRSILDGEISPRTEIVALNAGAALSLTGKAASLEEGLELAWSSIRTGAARQKLESLVKVTTSQVEAL